MVRFLLYELSDISAEEEKSGILNFIEIKQIT